MLSQVHGYHARQTTLTPPMHQTPVNTAARRFWVRGLTGSVSFEAVLAFDGYLWSYLLLKVQGYGLLCGCLPTTRRNRLQRVSYSKGLTISGRT